MKKLLIGLPYWHYKIDNFKKIKLNLKNLIKKFPLKKNNIQNFETNTYLNNEKHQEFKENFLLNVQEELNKFSNEIKNHVELTKVWAVNYKKGHDQILHHHGAIGYTGTLYLNYNKKIHSPLYFKQPWDNPVTGDCEFFTIEDIEESSLIIFASHIPHFVPINKSNLDRTIIGFDLKLLK